MRPDNRISAFRTSTSWGAASAELGEFELLLHRDWALELATLQVKFKERRKTRHVTVFNDKQRVLGFPWHDHVDQMLLESPCALPMCAPRSYWDDFEQGWWASITRKREWLYVAETDLGSVLDANMRGVDKPRLVRPGLVSVGRAQVLWHRVEAEVWERAWVAAIADIRDSWGLPAELPSAGLATDD
ncbi:MAG: hypothetical protein ACRCYU_19805 [Nocardioides sp.]